MLGAVQFGIWQIIRQLTCYMVMADIRSATTLKWIVSKNRTTAPANELRQAVTTSFVSSIAILPLYSLGGIVIVWMAPHLSNAEPAYYTSVRIASALLVLSFILTQILFLFESVLTGMNLSYKAMGVNPFATILGGLLMAGALTLGFGLPGLAASSVIVSLVTGLLMIRIVFAHVPWFGFARTSCQDVLSFTKLTGWFMASKIVQTLNTSSDVILLGYFASPAFVTAYVMSRYLMASLANFITSAFNATVPGLNRLVGEKRFDLISEARSQIITYLWVSLTAIGGTICLWNRPFISIWTSPDYFAGQIETFLIVMIAILNAVLSVDSSIMFMALEARKNFITASVAVFLVISLACLTIPLYQTLGLLISLFFGNVVMAIGYGCQAAHVIMKQPKSFILIAYFSRTPLFCLGLLAACAWLGTYLGPVGWFQIVVGMATSLAALSSIILFCSMAAEKRRCLLDNFLKISIFKLT